MKMIKGLGAIALVVLLTAAKATVGVDFNEASLAQLQVGRTTLPEAVAMLGVSPGATQVGASGATAYSWHFVQTKSSMWSGKTATEQKLAVLVFNTDGTFQRILRLQGITLDADNQRRLITDPAIKAAHDRDSQAVAEKSP